MNRRQSILAALAATVVPTMYEHPRLRMTKPYHVDKVLAIRLEAPPECPQATFLEFHRGEEVISYSFEELWEALKKG